MIKTFMQSIKFNDTFYLTIQDVNVGSENHKKLKEIPTNFITIIDVSGSMGGELGSIRTQLKNKLSNLVKENDTITIIWFSGNRDAGILKEEVEIKSLKSLQDLNNAIDKFIRPIGATAFNQPLILANEAIGRITKNRPDSLFSLIFMTDGYNNDCAWSDVIKSLKVLEPKLAASTFVEYGYYADSKAIAQMAEMVGGEKIEAQRFDDYDAVFASKIQKTYSSAKKVLVDVPTNAKFDFAFTISEDNEVILYGVKDRQVLVPENTKALLYFTSGAAKFQGYTDTKDKELNKLLYGSVYVLSEKLQTEYVDDVFKVLGDQQLYKTYSNAFGKQKLFAFKGLVKECIGDQSKQFLAGRSTNIVLDENAYCVMNLIDDLTKDENALVYPLHDEFNYNRIGAKKVAKSGELNEDQKNKIASAQTVEELKAITDNLQDTGALKFIFNDKTKGYSISNIVWSSDRANLSLNLRFDGYVELPTNQFGLTKFDTFIYRTYTVIKDGILNLSNLPISISQATYNKFLAGGVKLSNDTKSTTENPIVIADFSELPIINKKMVKSISAKKLGMLEYELFQTKALEKAYKYYDELHFPKKSKGFVDKYGTEAEAWLKTLGITEYNGFNPSMTTEKGTDFYMAVELNTKIAKHSAVPKIIDVIEKMKTGKALNPVDLLVKVAIDDYNTQINSKMYTDLTDAELKNKVLENWLKSVKGAMNKKRKGLMQEIAQIKFSLILSKKWFEEFATFEEDTLNLKVANNDLTIKFELTESQVNL